MLLFGLFTAGGNRVMAEAMHSDTPNPHIGVNPLGHEAQGIDWPESATVHMTVERPAGNVVYTADAVAGPASYNPDTIAAIFSLKDPRFDLQAGDIVSMTDETTSRSTTVMALQATSASAATDLVAGTADAANGDVLVKVYGGPDQTVAVTSGTWSADFSAYDLTPGMEGSAQQFDADGNFTQSDWRVLIPTIQAGVAWNWVQTRAWPLGDTLTMMIDSSGPFYGTVVSQNPPDAFDTGVFFDSLPDGIVHAGAVIHITSNEGAEKTYTATNIQVTATDTDANSVSGLATAGARVQVCIKTSDNCFSRWTSAGGDGKWSVNFGAATDPQDSPGTHTLKLGDEGWAGEDNTSGDSTTTEWRVVSPHIEVNPVSHWAHGVDWPVGVTLHMTAERPAGNTICSADAVSGPASWDATTIVADYNLWDPRCDLQAGDLVTMTDHTTTRSMTVMALLVSSASADTNIVLGTADAADGEVHVWVNNGPDQNVPVSAGHWSADFSSYDLKPGMNGSASQTDGNGNSTFADWHVPNPRIEINPVSHWAHGVDWPAGVTLHMTAERPAGNTICSADALVGPSSWDASYIIGDYNLWDPRCDLQAGDLVTMTDHTTTRSMTVMA
ncbi:MAG TPA: hypothetical protein VMT91_00915, partial [Anaerolineales bacterium]|nr:hypothetical protein [Anaerolineales bacterium]